jgi:hypothetical protein
VVSDDAEIPQPVEQVGVVAVAGEGLGVGLNDLGVKERQHGDLVVSADRGQDGTDGRVGERRHKIPRPGLWGGANLPGSGVFHRLKPEVIAEHPHADLVHGGEHARASR